MAAREVLRKLLVPFGGKPRWDLPGRREGDRIVVLVRHGEAAAGWGDDLDPGLSPAGRAQAEEMARALAPTGPLEIVASPLARTRQTAEPLAARWEVEPRIDRRVGEIVAPAGVEGLEGRAEWLRAAMAARWPHLGPEHQAWREQVLECLRAMVSDAVVVTHFIAINVAVGEATGDDRVVCFAPDHCSRTVVRLRGDEVQLLRLGDTAATEVR